MFYLKRDIKDLRRLEKILVVFFEEELGYYIHKAKLRSHLPFTKRVTPVKPLSDLQEQALRLRRAFEKLGPTFVKLGQLLSLRPDLVPEEYCREFEKLQDDVPSFPFAQVKKIIEEDFKKSISQLFKEFEKKPLASASMAQVHKATLPSGKKVVVKVQRPNIKETIDADLDILFLIAHSLEEHYPRARDYRPLNIVKEFALWTRKELNFKIEERNATRLKEIMKSNPRVKVPKMFPSFSSKRVLTMEYVEGVKINNLAALKKFKVSRKKIAMTYFVSILQQALLCGLFHADPHPANILVQKDGKLVYLDYGIMGELSATDRKKVIRFINSIHDKDPEKSTNIAVSLARETDPHKLDGFKREARDILEEVYFQPNQRRSIARAFYDIISLGAKYGVVFDPGHVLMAKAVYQAEGLGSKLDPSFNVSKGLRNFAEDYLKEKLIPAKIAQRLKGTFVTHKDLLIDFPEHLANIIERLEEEPKKNSSRGKRFHELEEKMERLQRRGSLGLAAVLLLLAAVFLFYFEGRKELFGIPWGALLLVLGLIILLYFVLLRKKHDWRENL